MRRTKEEAAQTRQEILRKAEQLFLMNGYENVTLEEIAAAASVTRGAVHWHFKNKQGILFALRDEFREPLSALAEEMMQDNASKPLDALADFVEKMFTTLHTDKRNKGMLRVMMYFDAVEPGAADKQAFQQALLLALTQIFTAADNRKKLSAPWTPAMAAALLSSSIRGLMLEWALDDATFELVPDGQNFIRMILKNWQA
ncbi:TetR/AcrR family transcriptional regulator [Agrobacterium sp. rho-13.3]|uniref:TetR/AcrR family transcriptional regulator n=1 Tax=Agrobacterium sp. rho-13.3 TaxID=3072980 RepID=UPI002A0EAF0B|nr:TetR family transcriptional regulator [Agrobacterium sp. rho-13.3]MDX8309245.1 TetR family transcriptional regulator [Agrobacterium sp. rho-13.3]